MGFPYGFNDEVDRRASLSNVGLDVCSNYTAPSVWFKAVRLETPGAQRQKAVYLFFAQANEGPVDPKAVAHWL